MSDYVAKPDEAWLGLDLGTQSVRAMAVSSTGLVLGSGSHPLTSHRDESRHEQNPEDWWNAIAAACRTAVADLTPGMIRGVAVDGTSGTILLVDRSGKPLTPALMYDDARAVEEVRQANGAGETIW